MKATATTDRRSPPPAPAADWALFLDVDGTLLEFAATPDGVRVPPTLPSLLERAAARLDGALALVSGRPLADVDRLFAPLRAPAAGLHGLERRSADGVLHTPPPPGAILSQLRREAEALAAAHPGALVEDKGVCLALHWRAAPGAAESLRSFARAALARLPGYRLQTGNQVLELRPAGADKGSAIDAFLAEPPFRGRRPVFVGDDDTDEHGFALVNARAGLSVLVGERRDSAAGYGLPDPATLRRWLADFATEPPG